MRHLERHGKYTLAELAWGHMREGCKTV